LDLEIRISDETVKQHKEKTHCHVSKTAFTRGRFYLSVPLERFQRTTPRCTYVKVYVTLPYVGKTRSRRHKSYGIVEEEVFYAFDISV
jgi:hypothetical protein